MPNFLCLSIFKRAEKGRVAVSPVSNFTHVGAQIRYVYVPSHQAVAGYQITQIKAYIQDTRQPQNFLLVVIKEELLGGLFHEADTTEIYMPQYYRYTIVSNE